MIASLVALVALGTTPRRALALSCALPEILAPRADQANVPLDTKLWFGYQVRGETVLLQLVGPEGEVALETVKVSLGVLEALVATPKRELAPSTSYVFQVSCATEGCGGTTHFTTGTARAARPALPVVLRQEPYTFDKYGLSDRAVSFEFEPQDLLVVVDVAGTSPFRADQPASVLTAAWGVDRVWVGDKTCDMPGAPFPADAGGRRTDTAPVRFGRIDLAGNFSGWTEARSVTLPPAAGGCSVGVHGGGGPSLGLVLAVLVAATFRRRARP